MVNKPIRVKELVEILKNAEPTALVIFENQTGAKNKITNTRHIIKDVILQKQEYINGEIAHHIVLVEESIPKNKKEE